ncbi:hypothetical protein [Brevibacillus borstelensis]|uniref:hypothetical protein n=1 Tax=Brevibacillus borstelensis TaxID=45462 RepID=UPI0030C290DD
MNYRVSLLSTEHNQALLELAATSDTGSDLFTVDRSPDFFALGATWGESRYYGLWKRDRLIGCLGVTSLLRFIGGQKTQAAYLHDFRLHPEYTVTRAFYRLVTEVVFALRKEHQWVYSIVWDSNLHRPSLVRGARLFPAAAAIGQTVHLGLPLFLPLQGSWTNVQDMDGETAWQHYEKWAPACMFAFADQERFIRDNGRFLGVAEQGRIVAVCKVADQSPVRKLVASRALPLALRLIHSPFRLRGAVRLPAKGQALPHAYIAHYASADRLDRRPAIFSYLSRHFHDQYAYAFSGLSAEEAARYRHPLAIRLGSTTYVYGDAPNGLTLSSHELTLM